MSTQTLKIFNEETLRKKINDFFIDISKDELFYKHLLLGKKPEKYKKSFGCIYYALFERFNCQNKQYLKKVLENALKEDSKKDKKIKSINDFEIIQGQDFVKFCDTFNTQQVTTACENKEYWDKTEW